MDSNMLFTMVIAVSVVLIGALAWVGERSKRMKRVNVLEFQRGVRFVDGVFQSVLEPGAYRMDISKEKIEVVDMRPQPVLIELFCFKDSEQNDWFISLGADLMVRDAYTTTLKLKHQVNDSVAIMRDALRKVVAGIDCCALGDKYDLSSRLEKEINNQLQPVGMRLGKLELTELWSQVPVQHKVGFVKA